MKNVIVYYNQVLCNKWISYFKAFDKLFKPYFCDILPCKNNIFIIYIE